MQAFLDALSTRRLVFVTGKGGVGKTVVAAALAQRAAEAGRTVLLIESSAAGQVAPLFGIQAPLHAEVPVVGSLSMINLDPPQCFREYVVKYLGQKGLYDRVFSHQLVQTFINTVPGFAELMMLGRLFYSCELEPPPRPDLVVFDCFASGHFQSLMTTPDAVLDAGFGGPMARETERVKAFMADPAKCAIVYVANAEPLVVSEAVEFLPRLAAKSPAQIAALVMNRVPPSLLGHAAAAAPGPATAGLVDARRALAERALRQLDEVYGDIAESIPELVTLALPDFGAIPEPWSKGFGAKFLSAARRIEVRRG